MSDDQDAIILICIEKQMSDDPNVDTANALAEQQRKLEEQREILMRGNITRSRVKWFEEAERSTKYFFKSRKAKLRQQAYPLLAVRRRGHNSESK